MLPKYYKNEMMKMFMSFWKLCDNAGFSLLYILSVCCGCSNDFFSSV